MIVHHCEQGGSDWLQARCGVATASRFSEARETVSGLNEQQAAYVAAIQQGAGEMEARVAAGYKAAPKSKTVAKALAGESTVEPSSAAIDYAWLIAFETIAREPLDDTFVTYAMRRGRELEPRARAVYERRTGAWIEQASLITTDDERFGYSTDGFRDDDGMIEIKCPLKCEKLGRIWSQPETAHLEYLDQIDGGLWITGRKYCDLVVYCPWLASVGKDLFVKRIYRNEDRIEALESDLVRFMRMVDGFLDVLRQPSKMSGAPRDEPAPATTPPWTEDAAPAAATAPTTKPAAKSLAPAF